MTPSSVSLLLVISFLFWSVRQLSSERKNNYCTSEISETGTCSCYRQVTSRIIQEVLPRLDREGICKTTLRRQDTWPLWKLWPWPSFGIRSVYFLVSLQFGDNKACLFFVLNGHGFVLVTEKDPSSPNLPAPLTSLLPRPRKTILWPAACRASPASWKASK